MKIKTAELRGVQLDVAVALAIGGKLERPHDAQILLNGMHQLCGEVNKKWSRYVFSPSTDWSQCGPLTRDLLVMTRSNNGAWLASCPIKSFDDENAHQWGDTLQIAICRAVVASKLGDEVDIPDELMEKTK